MSWHWDIRLKEYLDADWSHSPSPFVQVVLPYLPKSGTVLEIGAGAGQDSIWLASKGFDVTCTDSNDIAFAEILNRSKSAGGKLKVQIIDATKPMPFKDSSFDCVYAQLSLHYFNDKITHAMFAEIHRVLKPGGVLAIMMNSLDDPEYDLTQLNSEGLMNIKGLRKRYFSTNSLQNYVNDYKTILIDDNGRTPKDDAKHNSGMIRFIGKKI